MEATKPKEGEVYAAWYKNGAVVVNDDTTLSYKPDDFGSYYCMLWTVNGSEESQKVASKTIEIKEKKVYINGSFLEESWANINNDLRFLNSEVSGRDNFGPYIIGYNEYFVLSDNRDYGYDSRDFGSVNFSFINGKVINR